MNSYNAVARLGADPELKTLPSGKQVCNLRLAIDDGRDSTIWINGTLWERQAELAGQYLRKGSQIGITGSLTQRQWEDKNGSRRTDTGVTIHRFTFVGSRGDTSSPSATPPPRPAAPAPDDEIPF